jgi:D-3-phosphoglycerate dehydrogenase / 2-oxoglutarate reductase
MTFRVVATARSFCNAEGPHLGFLHDHGCELVRRAGEHPLAAPDLRHAIAEADAVILGLDQCDASALDGLARLRVISRYGAGVDNIDVAAATQRGIAVTNTPGANKIGVAELTLGLMLALARQLPRVAHAARHGVWQRTTGWEIYAKTLGVIGMGEIGREVAQRAVALGMSVVAFDPFWRGEMAGVRAVPLEALLADAHVVTLHTALTPETHHLINAERLALMRPGAVLINTARGGLIDEVALYQALQTGHLSGAAADVFQHDPPAASPLLALDTFIATPHIGATTRESVLRTALAAAQNAVMVLRGEPCPSLLNPSFTHARKPQ